MTGSGWMVVRTLATVLLLWAAVSDVCDRRVPRLAGYGMLGLGSLALLGSRSWIALGCYVLGIWCSRGGIWKEILVVGFLFSLLAAGLQLAPLLFGMILTVAAFWRGWLGGGDAQLAFGLLALGRGWWMLILLCGVTALTGMVVLIVKYRGSERIGRRIRQVLAALHHEPDAEAIRTPWALQALAAGILYLWVLPFLEVL